MENVCNYKEEIANTRFGCLGSSDGKLIAQVSALNYIPQSAMKRLAICKGLIPQEEIPKTAAIKAGDDLEMLVYEYLQQQDSSYQSNPMWVSNMYSRKNVKLISHPDFVRKDDARKMLYVYECKCTKFSFEETKQSYKAQLYIHYLLAKEYAQTLGRGWGVRIYLVHYSTESLNLEQDGLTFDANRLTVKPIHFTYKPLDIERAMNIIDAFLENYSEYYEGDEVDANLLPQNVQVQFLDIANVLAEIKERELKVSEFKRKLFDFMLNQGIKSIKNEVLSITRVDETESHTFDVKSFLAEYATKHPRKYAKLVKDFDKTITKKGYCNIKLRK